MMTSPPSERHVTGYSEQQVRQMLPKPELVDIFIGDVMMLAGNDPSSSVSILTSSSCRLVHSCINVAVVLFNHTRYKVP